MKTKTALILAAVLGLAAGGYAQTLTIISPLPAAPGSALTVVVTNNTAAGIEIVTPPSPFHILTPTGDLAVPAFVFTDAFIGYTLPVGQSMTYQVPLPAAIGTGSWVLLFDGRQFVGGVRTAGQAVARFDVGTPAPGTGVLLAYPGNVPYPFVLHETAPNLTPFPPSLVIGNAGPIAVTLGAGARLDVESPGGPVVASVPLAGLVLPPSGVARVSLPLGGLIPGPYTVRTSWVDPVIGPAVQTHGIQDNAGADLILTAGHVVPSAGSLPALFVGRTGAFGYLSALLAIQPGSTHLGGGRYVPFLLNDPLVLASVRNGVGGVISAPLTVTRPLGPFGFYWNSLPIAVNHPGPAFSGISLRLAGVAFTGGTGLLGLTQAEIITLQ